MPVRQEQNPFQRARSGTREAAPDKGPAGGRAWRERANVLREGRGEAQKSVKGAVYV